ncbi:MAG: hypothetical protein WBD27_10645 [Pyrinomonadaceae bacterium]
MKHKPERTVITIETFQRTTIHSGRRVKIVQCERCAAELRGQEPVAHVAVEDATAKLLPDRKMAKGE